MDFNINSKLLKDIIEYCNVNNIQDINNEINRLLRIGLNVDKYGMSPFTPTPNIDEKDEIKQEVKPKQSRTRKSKNVNVEAVAEIEAKSIEEPKPKKKIRIIKN